MKKVEIAEKLMELDENELKVLFEVPLNYRLHEARVVDTGHGRMLKVSFKMEAYIGKTSLSALAERVVNHHIPLEGSK